MDDGGEQVVEHAMGHSGSHKLPEGQHAALVGSTPAKQARQALSEAVQHAGLFAGHLALEAIDMGGGNLNIEFGCTVVNYCCTVIFLSYALAARTR